jgi:hypothetical protein
VHNLHSFILLLWLAIFETHLKLICFPCRTSFPWVSQVDFSIVRDKFRQRCKINLLRIISSDILCTWSGPVYFLVIMNETGEHAHEIPLAQTFLWFKWLVILWFKPFKSWPIAPFDCLSDILLELWKTTTNNEDESPTISWIFKLICQVNRSV